MYADTITDSMREAIAETNRRRSIQEAYNTKYGVIPTTIVKEIRPPLSNSEDESKSLLSLSKASPRSEIEKRIAALEKEMRQAAKDYDFERAAELRDIILETKADLGK
jgi:excinuclease ABC subunit B